MAAPSSKLFRDECLNLGLSITSCPGAVKDPKLALQIPDSEESFLFIEDDGGIPSLSSTTTVGIDSVCIEGTELVGDCGAVLAADCILNSRRGTELWGSVDAADSTSRSLSGPSLSAVEFKFRLRYNEGSLSLNVR